MARLHWFFFFNVILCAAGCNPMALFDTGSGGLAQTSADVNAQIRGELDGQLIMASSAVVIGKQHLLTAAHSFAVPEEFQNAPIRWFVDVGGKTREIAYVLFPFESTEVQPVTSNDIAVAIVVPGNDLTQFAKLHTAKISSPATVSDFNCGFYAVGQGVPQGPVAVQPETSVCLTSQFGLPDPSKLPEETQNAIRESGSVGSVYDEEGMGVFVPSAHPAIPEDQRNLAPDYPPRALVPGDSGGGVFTSTGELVGIIAGCSVLNPAFCQHPLIAPYAPIATVWIEPHLSWINRVVENCRDGMSFQMCHELQTNSSALALCEASSYDAHKDWSRNPLFSNLCLPSCGEMARLAGSSAGRAECHEFLPTDRSYDNPFTSEIEGDWLELTGALGQSHDCHHCMIWRGQASCSDLVNAYASQQGHDSLWYASRQQCLSTPFSAMTQEERAIWEGRFASKGWVNLGHLFGGAADCAECVLQLP